MNTFRIVIDADRCEANAICVQIAPEVFAIGVDDVAVVLDGVLDSGFDEQIEAIAAEAARRCPTGALRLEPPRAG